MNATWSTRSGPEVSARAEPRSLITGTLVFRWVWLIWMATLAGISQDELVRTWLAWSSIGAATAWTLWLTLARSSWNNAVMLFDVALSTWLIAASAFVVAQGDVVAGRPFFATGYPLSTPLLWGALRGPAVGAATAAALGLAHLLSRPLNGIALSELDPGQVQNVTGAMLNYLVAGVAVGLVARLLQRSAAAVRRANEETVKERELGARLAERESLARDIHDSVLQTLALTSKRLRELAGSAPIDPAAVGELAEIAARQQQELRSLILRPLEPTPAGRVSLRDALEEIAREAGIEVAVSTTGTLWLDGRTVAELGAAARQAVENVAQHSGADSATIFAEEDGGEVLVSIRDDGAGFEYDEARLEADGRVGLLRSVKGRVEDLGGSMTVTTSPGRGTEIELRIPSDP